MYTMLLCTHGRNNTSCIRECEERRDHSGPSLPLLCIIILLCYYYMIEPMYIIILRRIDITGSFAKNTIYFYYFFQIYNIFNIFKIFICTHTRTFFLQVLTHSHTITSFHTSFKRCCYYLYFYRQYFIRIYEYIYVQYVYLSRYYNTTWSWYFVFGS